MDLTAQSETFTSERWKACRSRPYFTLHLVHEITALRKAYLANNVSGKAPIILGCERVIVAALGTFVAFGFAQIWGWNRKQVVALSLGFVAAFLEDDLLRRLLFRIAAL